MDAQPFIVRFGIAICALSLALPSALAQSVEAPSSPALKVKLGDRFEPLGVRTLKVEARIVGHLAETRITTTFHNPHTRALSGEYVLPLPEGATVSGYGLDIGGVLVDGVVVDKDEGRRAFEAEVRKGVDPGLVEWTGGNSFKTRVFPIPAGGTRTVMVRYVAELTEGPQGVRYRLPLSFKEAIADFSLRVEVVQSESAPSEIVGGPPGLRFASWRNSHVAETKGTNIRLARDLEISLPSPSRHALRVERSSDDSLYFSARVTPASLYKRARQAQAKRVRVIWDASGSRASADLKRELVLLERYLEREGEGGLDLELSVVRHQAEEAKRFRLPGAKRALMKTLRELDYDGGTQLSSLAAPRGTEPFDQVLVFTDGVSNFGKEDPKRLGGPAWVFNTSTVSNHAFLRFVAMQSGGAYLNLARISDAEALAAVGAEVLTFMGARTAGGELVEGWPKGARPVEGAFTYAGRLQGHASEVVLLFGAGGEVVEEVRFRISGQRASGGELLRQLWAQKQLEELLIFPKRNAEAIRDLGRAFSIVTPSTSLIVLETLSQYLEHDIRPPASLKAMRASWDKEMAQRVKVKKDARAEKLEAMVKLWEARTAWYDKRFSYPKDFKWGAGTKGLEGGRGGVDRVRSRRLGSGSARVAESSARVMEEAEAAPMDAVSFESESVGAAPPPAPAAGGLLGSPKVKKRGGGKRKPEATIVLAAWDPKTPYLTALKGAKPKARFETYMAAKEAHGKAPAFFLDCADYFHAQGDEATSLQVLSNIAEMELEDPALLRILAHRLVQREVLDLAILLFERILRLRPEEPQSLRDLALALERRADKHARSKPRAAKEDYARALALLEKVVMKTWDRFAEIELIALVEFNHIVPKAKRLGLSAIPMDKRLIRPLELDVRIAMSWDADMTDMDMHIVEPSGEEAYYSHNRTTIGGLVSRDFTQGYGPEVYLLRRAMPGKYSVKTKYFGSSAAKLAGAVTLQVDIFTDYGRPNEKRRSLTFRLTEKKELFTVGEISL